MLVNVRMNGEPNYDCELVNSSTDTAALYEGWADFFSAAIQFNKNKNVDRNTTVILDNIHNTDNVITCDNNLKYSGLKHIRDSPDNYYYGGSVWKTVLYEAFYNIIENYPSTEDYLQFYNYDVYDDESIPGNVLFLKIVLEGMKVSGCNPIFIRARNSIIHTMEKNQYTGSDIKFQCLVWKAFGDRGLGYNAIEPLVKNKLYLYHDNYDLPEHCHNQINISYNKLI